MFCLTDIVSFYCSAETVFAPELRGKSIVVLSNNDGALVSANDQALALGVKKFEPYFKMKPILDRFDIEIRSSNYELYGALSSRVMAVLEEMAPDTLVYSIDEAFNDHRQWIPEGGFRAHGHAIIKRVKKETGLPVRVGFGQTLTLCKVANVVAKRVARANGVCCIDSDSQRLAILNKFPIGEVWGVGRAFKKRLKQDGYHSAADLAQANMALIRKRYGVIVERTARELAGEACIPFHPEESDKKQIVVSRAFGEKVNCLDGLISESIRYLTMAMAKLRKNNLLTSAIIFSARCSEFRSSGHKFNTVIGFPTPTNDTSVAAALLTKCIRQNALPNQAYARSMICLTNLSSATHTQSDLFSKHQSNKSIKLMEALDAINEHNSNTVVLGQSLRAQQYKMKRDFKSPNFLGSWLEIPVVKC